MKIFLSYGNPDLVFARRLFKDLVNLGFEVRSDFYQIRAGDKWDEKITQFRDEADTFIICVSQKTVEFEYLIKEVEHILDLRRNKKDIRIIPVLVDSSIRQIFSGGFELLKEYHIARFHISYSRGLTELLRGLSKPRIFISYRREDSSETANKIYESLKQKFPDSLVFDVETIPLGVNIKSYLRDIIRYCFVQIVIIGEKWVDIRDKVTNEKRLNNPADFVRLEIESAIKEGIAIIPVLVDKANMPHLDDLPESIKSLGYRNALDLSEENFEEQIQKLIKRLEEILQNYV